MRQKPLHRDTMNATKLRTLMRLSAAALFYVVTSIVLTGIPAVACTCIPLRPGETVRDRIQSKIDGSKSIFEGTVRDIDMVSPRFSARVGDLVPAMGGGMGVYLKVTFDVARTYRGPQQNRVSVETGSGGGDCGYPFQLDEKYLVFGYGDDSGSLQTGICTETGPIAERTTALSILRGEPEPTTKPKLHNDVAAKLCGKVVRDRAAPGQDAVMRLLRRTSKWPMVEDEVDVNASGAFCFDAVDEGKYLLVFMTSDDDNLNFFSYYPGVASLSAAKTIDVHAGSTLPSVSFKVSPSPTVTVSGRVVVPDGSPLPDNAAVALLNTENPFVIAYTSQVGVDGSFAVSDVQPGTYWAFAGIDGSSDDVQPWFTRKVEVKVERSIGGLSLELVHK
jgi:hypothetical protein